MRFIVALCCLAVAVQGQATCAAYCSNVLTNCVGANAVYDTTVADVTAACMTECAAFPQTTATDLDNTTTSSGNTLGCREYHAGAAATNAAVHCPHASPASTLCNTGSGKGSCDDFCNNLMKTCPTALLGGNWAACSAACSMYADKATFPGAALYPVAAGMGVGDLGCRRYHVTAARTDATTHCPHADLLGGGVCGMSMAASFCQADAFCPVADTGFADVATCMSIWMNIPAGAMMDVAGDTRYCRAYHLSVALQGGAMKTTHCPHTGQQGNGACGTACDAYCSQYTANCTGVTGAAAYTSMDNCKSVCATTFNNNTMVNTGNNLGCRLYHVGVAQTSLANSLLHCPHASQSGGGATGPCGATMVTTKAPTAAGSPAATAVVSGFAVAAAVAAFFL